jgi:hypothetical protein
MAHQIQLIAAARYGARGCACFGMQLKQTGFSPALVPYLLFAGYKAQTFSQVQVEIAFSDNLCLFGCLAFFAFLNLLRSLGYLANLKSPSP